MRNDVSRKRWEETIMEADEEQAALGKTLRETEREGELDGGW